MSRSSATPWLRERLAIPAQALRGREDVRPVAEEADPAMTCRDQVLDGGARAAHVVADHRVRVDEVAGGGRRTPAPGRRRARAADRSCRGRRVATISPSTPRAMNASASSRSRSASSSELPTSVSTPRSRAASSTPRCTEPKNGLLTSSKITPMRRRLAIGAAQGAGREVVAVAEHVDGARTRSARSSRTPAPPLTTRDTVLRLTPATAATSRMVGRGARCRSADSGLTTRMLRTV